MDAELQIAEHTHSELARAYFKEGYNCSQSVFMVFCEQYDMDLEMALKIGSSFGAGMGRLREVCRDLLGLDAGKDNPVPELRTVEYYQKRPCAELVAMAADIMNQYIEEHR